jgi:hypothetical protein
MSAPLILMVGLIYFIVALDSALRGNTGIGIAFAGYAFSNIGLYMLAK